MPAPIYWTADMVRALPDDGNRYEVVYGELLVTPGPRPWHQFVVHRLSVAIELYLRAEPVGLVVTAPADISWGRMDVLVQPDLFVLRPEDARTLQWSRMHGLLLAIEVLSPSSQRSDRFSKRKRYQDARVPLYWIVDADEHVVEVWAPADEFPSFERERLTWHPAGATAAFTLELAELFRPL